MAKKKTATKLGILLTFVLFLFSCNAIVEDSESNTLLLIVELAGTDMEGNPSNFLQSDVLYTDSQAGTSTIFADIAKATLKAEPMNPNPEVMTSVYNDIELSSYTVHYARSDGKNVEGVDIPYAFEGTLAGYIEAGTAVDISFVVVREVAKMEPPLLGLREGRSDGVLQMTARIDFYGKDLSGNGVKATGYLTIYFANYAND